MNASVLSFSQTDSRHNFRSEKDRSLQHGYGPKPSPKGKVLRYPPADDAAGPVMVAFSSSWFVSSLSTTYTILASTLSISSAFTHQSASQPVSQSLTKSSQLFSYPGMSRTQPPTISTAMYYYDDEEILERDTGNDNPEGLPTYDYLDEQERANPNSRLVWRLNESCCGRSSTARADLDVGRDGLRRGRFIYKL